jgi:hypothetical protein
LVLRKLIIRRSLVRVQPAPPRKALVKGQFRARGRRPSSHVSRGGPAPVTPRSGIRCQTAARASPSSVSIADNFPVCGDLPRQELAKNCLLWYRLRGCVPPAGLAIHLHGQELILCCAGCSSLRALRCPERGRAHRPTQGEMPWADSTLYRRRERASGSIPDRGGEGYSVRTPGSRARNYGSTPLPGVEWLDRFRPLHPMVH